MLKIESGILKQVFTEEQYDLIKQGKISPNEIEIEDTIKSFIDDKNEEVEYIQFRLSYKDVDRSGKEKYIFNEETQEYEVVYIVTKKITAFKKEMRIILELEKYNPIKVVIEEKEINGIIQRNAICIQNQLCGKKYE